MATWGRTLPTPKALSLHKTFLAIATTPTMTTRAICQEPTPIDLKETRTSRTPMSASKIGDLTMLIPHSISIVARIGSIPR